MNDPGLPVEFVYVNDILSEDTDATSNVPLYPLIGEPLVLLVSVTLVIITWSPISRLCGSSVITVEVFVLWEHVEINLGFLLYSKSFKPIVDKVKSVFSLTPVVLDSWIINPDSGVFAFSSSLGITTLNL